MIAFRPHHFLCTLGFAGKGYSPDFVKNFQTIADTLRSGEGNSLQIQVVRKADSICKPCPSRRGEGCETQDKIDALDESHARILDLKEGEILTWGEAKGRIRERMQLEKFHQACARCSWKALGICEARLKELQGMIGAVLLAIGLVSHWANAANPAKAAKVEAPIVEEASITPMGEEERAAGVEKVLLVSLKGKSPKALATLKSGYDAFSKKKWATSKKLGLSLGPSSGWADYGIWLVASSQRHQAEAALESHAYPQAIALAEASAATWAQLPLKDPYSVHLKKLPEEWAANELIQAQARLASRQLQGERGARETFERAFQRLAHAGGGALSGLTASQLRDYVKSCLAKKSKTAASLAEGAGGGVERCAAWIYRLSAVFSRQSPEYRALTESLPEGWEPPAPARPVNRWAVTYRAADPDVAAFESAFTRYLEGNKRDAREAFRKMLEDYPRSAQRNRARYWLGKALVDLGEEDQGREVFEKLMKDAPLSFQSLSASLITGKDLEDYLSSPEPVATSQEPTLSPIELTRLKRAEALVRAGIYPAAVLELKELKARETFSSDFLVYLAALNSKAGYHLGAFQAVTELFARGSTGILSPYAKQLIFPVVYFDLIKKSADELKVDPILALSLIKQESAFDPSALSPVGALGLMQLMPMTALDTDPKVDRKQLLEPAENIRVGIKYLAQLLNRFNGNIVLSLAAYNAGPAAVDRWIRENKSISSVPGVLPISLTRRKEMIEFIETIPFRETREYVGAIVRNYYWYSRKGVVENTFKSLDYFWSPHGPWKTPASSSASSSRPTSRLDRKAEVHDISVAN